MSETEAMTKSVLNPQYPPIIEALVDFRVTAPPVTDPISIVAKLADWREDFPHWQEVPSSSMRFAMGTTPPVAFLDSLNDGIRLTDRTNQRVCIVRPSGFTFSLLCEPKIEDRRYQNWETFVGQMSPWWSSFKSIFQVSTVQRVGARFLNRLHIDSTSPIYESFNLGSNIPEPLDQNRLQHWQVILSLSQINNTPGLNLNCYRNRQELFPGIDEYILDIDAYLDNLNKSVTSDDKGLQNLLLELRSAKNTAFENALTESLKQSLRTQQ